MHYVDTDYVTSFGRTIRSSELAGMIAMTILNFRKVSGRAPRIVLIPLLQMSGSRGGCNHWTMLVNDPEKREYVHYDSLKGSTEHVPKIISDQIAILETRLRTPSIYENPSAFQVKNNKQSCLIEHLGVRIFCSGMGVSACQMKRRDLAK